MKITGTLDIECADWDRFAVAATCTRDESWVHRSIGELVDWLIARPKTTWWAHCGGNYDFLAIAEELRRRGIPASVDLAGSRASRLVGGGFVLRDSYPLLGMPLDRACELAGVSVPTLGLRCVCGRLCGGYCTIRPDDPRPQVADYCVADCRALLAILEALEEIAADAGLELRGTLGGTAWATARKTLGLPDAALSPALWRRARESYYGGRVTIARPIADGPGDHWDLSSAYPAALARAQLPVGTPMAYGGSDARACLSRERPGVYRATVTIPDMFLPPLPVHTKDRIAYPVGTVQGTWVLPELLGAIARGCTVRDVGWALVWDTEANFFSELMLVWFQHRHRAGKTTALGEWWRLLCNSLTGKLAQGPERYSAKLFPSEIRFCRAKFPCSVRRCVGACGAMSQLDLWGQVWGVPFFRPAASGHIAWAAYLTAHTRLTWLSGAESQGQSLVYGDTDSLWTTGENEPEPNGDALGCWQWKHAWRSWSCAAPRAYRYEDASGGVVVRTSGMSVTDEEWLAGAAVNDRGVLTFLEAAASSRGLFRRRGERSWNMPKRGYETGWFGDRRLDTRTGLTYPSKHGQKEASQASGKARQLPAPEARRW